MSRLKAVEAEKITGKARKILESTLSNMGRVPNVFKGRKTVWRFLLALKH